LGTSSILDKYRQEINQLLVDIYPEGPRSLAKPIQYVLSGGGKRLRPILTLFCANACGGNKENAMPAALAVEILHNFTLVHDDIMDRDIIRHGQQTVHSKWDDGVAILTGDAMLSLALKLINQTSSLREKQMSLFIDGLLAVCEGQALDKEYEDQLNVSLDDYMNMIDLKTGYLIGLSAQIGATSANIDLDICLKLRNYGRFLGRAFQIQDDYLEIFSNSKEMGKSLKSDILLGKKTFLMIIALEKDRKIIENYLHIINKDFASGLAKIRDYLKESGIVEDTINEVNKNIELANKQINSLDIKKNDLLYLSELIRKRGS